MRRKVGSGEEKREMREGGMGDLGHLHRSRSIPRLYNTSGSRYCIGNYVPCNKNLAVRGMIKMYVCFSRLNMYHC